jgi:hypothetical protein
MEQRVDERRGLLAAVPPSAMQTRRSGNASLAL